MAPAEIPFLLIRGPRIGWTSDTELALSDYLILNSDDSFYSNNPIPMSAAVITELVFQNPSNHKNYYFTLLCDDCIHTLYITDKPFKGTLCAIMDSEDQDLFTDIVENKPALSDSDGDENLQETKKRRPITCR